MPRNGKEGILFSFSMSAIMIYVMAALNYGVRLGDIGSAAWSYALFNFPLAYVIGMICDLCLCTPLSRKITRWFCDPSDRALWKGICTKFCMVVLMTVCMTIFGAVEAVGFNSQTFAVACTLFPYNFAIALPIQMLIVAPICGKFVNFVGDKLSWNTPVRATEAFTGVKSIADIVESDVYAVSQSSTVLDALKLITDKNISGVPVVSEKNDVVGFVSDSDILRHLSKDNAPVSDITTLVTGMARGEYPKTTFSELMSKPVMSVATENPICVKQDSDLENLCSIFGYDKFKKVPVVDSEGKLNGIVNRSALVKRALGSYVSQEGSNS